MISSEPASPATLGSHAIIRNCLSCGRANRIPARHLADTGKCGACKAALSAIAEPIEVNEAEFAEIVHESKVPVLVDFWASRCGPCRMAAPHVAQAARDLAGHAVVLKVDTEEFPQLASQYNVRSIPNLKDAFNSNKQAWLIRKRWRAGGPRVL